MTTLHPWNITLAQLQERISHCDPENRKLLESAYRLSGERDMTVTEFADSAGISSSTLAKILAGTYVNPRNTSERYDLPTNISETLRTWQTGIIERMPTNVSFVSTETSRKVNFNCELARESRTPVFMQGASHIGKTTSLEKYADANPHNTYLITITAGMSAKGLATAIAEAMDIAASGSVDAITRRIRKELTRDKLLILDDFHVLTLSATPRGFLKCMELLRALYDADKCGMLFSTTDLDFGRISKEYKTALHQLLRRGIHRPHLGLAPLKKDVKAILAAHGLPWPAKALQCEAYGTTYRPATILEDLAKQSGLKSITERLRYALKLAARNAEAIGWHHLCQAQALVSSNDSIPADDWND